MFSYWDGSQFTLIDARVGDVSRPNLIAELRVCGKSKIDTLHITSWDADHCCESALREILDTWSPNKIEYPGYEPKKDTGKTCQRLILDYKERQRRRVVKIDPPYIDSLDRASSLGYTNIFYWPKRINVEYSNDNSSAKFFRTGCFNVLSLGDLESQSISNYLKDRKTLRNETDVLILAHHGAHNGFTTRNFLKNLKPSIAVCSANHGNQFEHPKPEIQQLLKGLKIPYKTTKRGDVVIVSEPPHRRNYTAYNLRSDSTELQDVEHLKSKKSILLANPDRARSHFNKPKNPFSRFQ